MQAFVRRLEHWESLLSSFSPEGMSSTARQGLFGELHVLRYLLTSGTDPGRALAAWVGPLRQPQDLIVPGVGAAEVKTLAYGSSTIRISSAAQLDETPFSRLFLVAIHLGPPDQPGETLPMIVKDLMLHLIPSPGAPERLDLRLREAGYLDVQAALYQDTAYSVKSAELLVVEDDFPRLRQADLPPALGDLTYSLNLTGLASYGRPFSDLLTLFSHG